MDGEIHPQARRPALPERAPARLPGLRDRDVPLRALDAGWVPATHGRTIGILLATFVFPLELVATIMAFLTRDTGAATSLGLFTTSWLAIGVLTAAVPELGGGKRWDTVSGWIPVALFAGASTRRSRSCSRTGSGTVLPLFRIGAARGANEGDLSEQLRGLAGEAGVRQAL